MSSIRENERGMVSILVSMIMIIVISLIVIGFSQVSRRNQREALDNQLSAQAYYAAESGVNAAIQYFNGNDVNALDPQSHTDCRYFVQTYLTGGYGTAAGNANVLDANTQTMFTCLLVNPAPGSLEATPVKQEENTVWHLHNESEKPFHQLSFQWSTPASGAGTGSCPAVSNFPTYTAWNSNGSSGCRFGILRVELADTANVSGSALENGTGVTTLYLVPSNTATVPTYTVKESSTSDELNTVESGDCTGSHQGCPAQILNASCPAGSTTCKVNLTLNKDNSGNGSMDYYTRITMIYKDSSDLVLSGTDSDGKASNFKDAQALIDVTGKSQDELRRVQVRIPLNAPSSALPGYGLMSTDTVCKQINAASPPVKYIDSCPAT